MPGDINQLLASILSRGRSPMSGGGQFYMSGPGKQIFAPSPAPMQRPQGGDGGIQQAGTFLKSYDALRNSDSKDAPSALHGGRTLVSDIGSLFPSSAAPTGASMVPEVALSSTPTGVGVSAAGSGAVAPTGLASAAGGAGGTAEAAAATEGGGSFLTWLAALL